jgi:uncharacterized protein (UPF0333 family)
MIPARKGQTALEYLLIIVVAIIVVVAVYTWMQGTTTSSTQAGSRGVSVLELAAQTAGEPIATGKSRYVYNPDSWSKCPNPNMDYFGVLSVTPANCGSACEGKVVKFTSGPIAGRGGRISYMYANGVPQPSAWCIAGVDYLPSGAPRQDPLTPNWNFAVY